MAGDLFKRMLTIQVTFSDGDCARATRFIMNRRRATWIAYSFPLIFVAGLGLVLWLVNPDSVRWWYVPALSLLLLWFYLMLIIAQKWGLKRQMRKHLKSNPSAQSPQIFTFTDDGITLTGTLFNLNLEWKAIVEALESKTDFFLYISKNWAYFLPKQCFASQAQKQELRDILRHNLGERAKFEQTKQ